MTCLRTNWSGLVSAGLEEALGQRGATSPSAWPFVRRCLIAVRGNGGLFASIEEKMVAMFDKFPAPEVGYS